MFKLTIIVRLGLLSGAALLSMQTAWAQQTSHDRQDQDQADRSATARQDQNTQPEPKQAQKELGQEDLDGVIIVRGRIGQSQIASVKAKRDAVNLVDVAAADSVGRFPDQNTAGALARLPGVAVQRDQGQARYIQVRGAPNRWTSVSIDGIPQIGTDEGGESRAYRFDAVPAVLLSELRVNKSLTPNLTPEAITANIDMRSYSPLSDYGLNVSGDIGYGFMDLGNGEQRQASLRASWASDHFGIALGGSHYRRKQVTDNREAGYDEFGPTDIDIRNYRLERTNNGLFSALEFSPIQGQKFYLRGIYTEFNDDEQRNDYQIELENAASGTRGLESGDLVGVPVTAANNFGEYRNKNYIFSTGMDYEDKDGLTLNIALGYSRTENTTNLPIIISATTGTNSPSLSYDRSEDPRFPIVSLYQTIDDGMGNLSRGEALDSFDQTSVDPSRAILLPVLQKTTSDAMTAKFDISKAFGQLSVKAGGLAAIRDIEGNNIGVGRIVPLITIGYHSNQYVTDTPWDTRFLLGVSFNYVDNVSLNNELQAALKEADIDPKAFVQPTSLYDQFEENYAGYLMGQWQGDNLLLSAGARLEYYALDNSGFISIDGAASELENRKDYLDIFPSINTRYNLSDDLVVRLSGQRGVSRPAYASIRVGASINDIEEMISGGNPNLLPEYTWGIDSSLEYYFPGNGLVSLSGFYRWVDNVLYQSEQAVERNLYDSNGVDRSAYLLGSTFNGSNGKLYGVEFNVQHQFDFLPGALSGFGVQGNLTLLDGDFDALQPDGDIVREQFQGLSDTVVNASVFYEKYGISARISYQWRSEYLDTLGGLGAGEFRDSYENLDISLRYQLTENFTLFADLANLTDEIYVAYQGTSATLSEVEQIGARYLFGMRFDLSDEEWAAIEPLLPQPSMGLPGWMTGAF